MAYKKHIYKMLEDIHKTQVNNLLQWEVFYSPAEVTDYLGKGKRATAQIFI